MSVHQKKDGRWFVQYRDPLKPKNKKKKYFGRGEDAELKARGFNESLGLSRRGRKPKDNSPYFSDMVNDYAAGRLAHIQESTLTNFMWKMKGIILPELGNLRVMSITPKKIDVYVQKRLTESRTIKQVSSTGATRDRVIKPAKKTTIHRELSDIKAVLNWAVGRKLIAFNPIAAYQMPKRDDEFILYPGEDEINAILTHSPDRLIRAISISYYTGLRPGGKELFPMKWNHVDFKANTIMVKSAKKGAKYKHRLVPIHPDFTDILKQWYDADGSPNGYIIHYQGQPVKSLKKAFATAKQKAGVTRRLRLYDFRHAFASLLLKHAADLKATSELLGHSRTDTTTRIYQHVDFKMHQDAVGKLPALNIGHPKNEKVTKIIPFKRKAGKGL